jgi:hypothetical protein
MKNFAFTFLLISLGWPSAQLVGASEDSLVAARIGVQLVSGDVVRRARSRDRVRQGDQLRIYVEPESRAHIYIIHTDYKTLTLVEDGRRATDASKRVMSPVPPKFYDVDGTSAREVITVLVSPQPLEEVTGVFEGVVTNYGQWKQVEDKLASRSRIDLSEEVEKPYAIAGNVRQLYEEDAFAEHLITYSGKSLIVKRFEFRVEK